MKEYEENNLETEELTEGVQIVEDELYTEEGESIEAIDIQELTEDEEEETVGGASVSRNMSICNINRTMKRSDSGIFVSLKGYQVFQYFSKSVAPRGAEAKYSSGNQWVIRKPYKNWTGVIRAEITVQADANYGRTRRKMKNIVTVKCL